MWVNLFISRRLSGQKYCIFIPFAHLNILLHRTPACANIGDDYAAIHKVILSGDVKCELQKSLQLTQQR
jgi:hypothetical protein